MNMAEEERISMSFNYEWGAFLAFRLVGCAIIVHHDPAVRCAQRHILQQGHPCNNQTESKKLAKLFHIVLILIGALVVAPVFFVSKILSFRKPAEVKKSQPWLESFIILYFSKCLNLDSDTKSLACVYRGELNFSQTQSLMIYLKAYLHKIGEVYIAAELTDVIRSFPKVLAIHTVGFQSEGAVRYWCQNQNPDGSKDDVDAFIAVVKSVDKKSEDWADLSLEFLKFRIEHVFKKMFGENFWSYTDDMLEDYASDESGNGITVSN